MASTFLSDMYAALSSTAEADAVVRLFLRRERNISAYDARTFIDDPNMQGLPPQAVLLLNAFFFGAQGGPPSDADAARFVTDVAAKVAAADPKQLQQLPRKSASCCSRAWPCLPADSPCAVRSPRAARSSRAVRSPRVLPAHPARLPLACPSLSRSRAVAVPRPGAQRRARSAAARSARAHGQVHRA